MIERLDAIGGSLHISSSPGTGTRVTATVPAAIQRAGGSTASHAVDDGLARI